MRWIFLIAVIVGIGWTANWSFHQLDQAVLITDYSKADAVPKQWALVDFSKESPDIYHYTGTSQYWGIFTGLWPIWSFFCLIFLLLIPLSIFIYNGFNERQIAAAKEAMDNAKKQADDKTRKAEIYKQTIKQWAEKQIKSAYDDQLKRVHQELEQEWQSYHELKDAVLKREQTIRSQELTARKIQNEAKRQITEIQHLYAQELQRFEAETEKLKVANDNAMAGYQRLKNKKSTQKRAVI